MYKFVYVNKKTKNKVYSEKPLSDKDLLLVVQARDMKIKSNKVLKK
jgi:hypothetical protein